MSYFVRFLGPRGGELYEGGGGCYGFIGKGSYCNPLCSEEQLKELNDYLKENNFCTEHLYNGCEGRGVPYKGTRSVHSIEVREGTSGWCSLDWLLLVKSVPQIGNTILSGEEEYNKGYFLIDTVNVGADETIQALMTLAAESRYNANPLYSAIKEANVPNFLKLYFSLAYSYGVFQLAYGDSTLFYQLTARQVKAFCDGVSPRVCPLSFNDIRIYPMTVLSRWKIDGYEGISMEDFCGKHIKTKTDRVNGHFGPFYAQYIENPVQQIENLWSELCQLK